MEYFTLNNGIKMPILGFGTFLSSGDECEKAVCTAINNGYRLIDTAEAYGNEEFVGNGIKQSGVNREEIFITTKVNFKSYENTRETVINSLKKLKVDYIDMVLLHWPFGNVYKGWRELEKLYKEGIIKAIGISNFDPDRLIDIINFNDVKPVLNQIETNIYCQRKEEHKWQQKYGVVHQAYAPLGQGKINEVFNEVIIKNLAEKYNKTPAQIMLRFLIQSNVAVIPKSVHKERIIENISIFDFKLENDEMESLKSLDRNSPLIGNAEKPEFVEFAMTW